MDPLVQVALISGVVAIVTAVLTRPTVVQHKRLKRIEGEFSRNGGSTAKDDLAEIKTGLVHLSGRFDQYVIDSATERDASHKEAIRMWSAIEAVAHAQPPDLGDRP